MKEVVIISGKGGTGKTSLSAAFASLARDTVFADCDVDAADLHLILKPDILRRETFMSGHEAVINPELCVGCGACFTNCQFEAVTKKQNESGAIFYSIETAHCEGCAVCVRLCPHNAIDFVERMCGEWYESVTRFGPMVHARLGVVAENSGRLVSLVRKEAKRVAKEQQKKLILVDGPPGISCPVIAAIGGADAILIITEPTLSGLHDFERVVQLANHFEVPTFLCINKWDINERMCKEIEDCANRSGIPVLGRILYSDYVTKAQLAGQSLIEFRASCEPAKNIKVIWDELCRKMNF